LRKKTCPVQARRSGVRTCADFRRNTLVDPLSRLAETLTYLAVDVFALPALRLVVPPVRLSTVVNRAFPVDVGGQLDGLLPLWYPSLIYILYYHCFHVYVMIK